jgi:hypothetical protein
MNARIVRPSPRLPLPREDEHEAWVVDTTPTQWVRKTWPGGTAPYRYTPAGQIVRLAMPTRGYMRYQPLVRRLTDRIERMRMFGDLPSEFYGAGDWTDDMRAMVVLATVLAEKRTPFVVYNIGPSGRVWFFQRLRRRASWHPDAPRPKGGA